jgi:hypothetical protein
MYAKTNGAKLAGNLRMAQSRTHKGLYKIIEHIINCCKSEEQREAVETASSTDDLSKVALRFMKENPFLAYSIFRKKHIDCAYHRIEAVDMMVGNYEGLTAQQIKERQIDAVGVLKEMGDLERLTQLRDLANKYGNNIIAEYADYFVSRLGGRAIIAKGDPCKKDTPCPFNKTNCPKYSQRELDEIAESTI